MADTTLVGISRLKDFSLFEGRIGTVIQSYSSTPPAGCLYLGVNGTTVSKTEWSELYNIIGNDATNDTFTLPYKADEGNIKHYIVGKILLSEITTSGNVVVANFSQDDLDDEGYYTFKHGFGHAHPILQLYDNNGEQCRISQVYNSIGQSKILINTVWLPTIKGTWNILAIG